jgi:hypothetical protein
MAIEFSTEANLAIFRISGKLEKDEFDLALSKCKALIKTENKIKILAVLEHFKGWKNAGGWDDMSFANENDQYIQKIALVGNPEWHDMAYAFMAKDLRPMPIKFFEENQEKIAVEWINNGR